MIGLDGRGPLGDRLDGRGSVVDLVNGPLDGKESAVGPRKGPLEGREVGVGLGTGRGGMNGMRNDGRGRETVRDPVVRPAMSPLTAIVMKMANDHQKSLDEVEDTKRTHHLQSRNRSGGKSRDPPPLIATITVGASRSGPATGTALIPATAASMTLRDGNEAVRSRVTNADPGRGMYGLSLACSLVEQFTFSIV